MLWVLMGQSSSADGARYKFYIYTEAGIFSIPDFFAAQFLNLAAIIF